MSPDALDTGVKLVGAVSAIAVAFIGGWWTYLRAKAAVKESPYDSLANRVVALEEADRKKGEEINRLRQSDQRKGLEITHLRGEVTVLSEYAVEVHEWIEAGMPPPPPMMGDRAARVVKRLREGHDWQHVSHPGD